MSLICFLSISVFFLAWAHSNLTNRLRRYVIAFSGLFLAYAVTSLVFGTPDFMAEAVLS